MRQKIKKNRSTETKRGDEFAWLLSTTIYVNNFALKQSTLAQSRLF
jgi:hypothetical protein